MPVSFSQQMAHYFEHYAQVEVTFTKEVNQALRINAKHVSLKCLGSQWPCVLYSASLKTARIIANLQGSLNESLAEANNLVSLRLSINDPDKPDPVTFFVPARVGEITPYDPERAELSFVDLTFTQRPPEYLIEMIGGLVDTKSNSRRRKDERIGLTPATTKELALVAEACSLDIDGVPRRAILKNLSFSGCKSVVVGVPQFMVDKPAAVHLRFEEPDEQLVIAGKVCRFDPVEGREDVATFAIQFDEKTVPMSYKIRLNRVIRRIPQAESNAEQTEE